MLSRVADNLYWMSRYLERAEHTARLIDVHINLILDQPSAGTVARRETLLAALGAWMGWQMLPLVVLMSSFVGAVLGIGMIVLRGRDRNIPIPFGPYLAIAGWLCLLWGDQLVARYLAFAAPNF